MATEETLEELKKKIAILNEPITGITALERSSLNKVGIKTYLHALLYFPNKYEDHTRILDPLDCINAHALFELSICSKSVSGSNLFIDAVSDADTHVHITIFKNQNWHLSQLLPGSRIRVFGTIIQNRNGSLSILHPKYKLVNKHVELESSITPIYPNSKKLSQKTIRKAVKLSLNKEKQLEFLASDILKSTGLPALKEAIQYIHNPPSDLSSDGGFALMSKNNAAWKRIKFEELISHKLKIIDNLALRMNTEVPVINSDYRFEKKVIESLPFKLRPSQLQAYRDIKKDLRNGYPMLRLLQGDVGSGKTIVATLSSILVSSNGYQTAIMAPTEILAKQHYDNIKEIYDQLGIRCELISSSLKAKDKKKIFEDVRNGRIDACIGTHSLIQSSLEFNNLSLVIIDEQHKFGVNQRLKLVSKGMTQHAHQLIMTATPIPRTLAMAAYADMKTSTIDHTKKEYIDTYVLSSIKKPEIIEKVRKACSMGMQGYWVCPNIGMEDNYIDDFSIYTSECVSKASNVIDLYAELKEKLPEYEIGMLHAKLSQESKLKIIQDFKDKKISWLVTTTIIEAGIDIPGATVIIINDADHFGVAQLHQIRGRVGRGPKGKGVCILLYNPPCSPNALIRLNSIKNNTDGMKISLEDLKIRGPGDILRQQQSGSSNMRFADLEKDAELAKLASKRAVIMKTKYPELSKLHNLLWMMDDAQEINI